MEKYEMKTKLADEENYQSIFNTLYDNFKNVNLENVSSLYRFDLFAEDNVFDGKLIHETPYKMGRWKSFKCYGKIDTDTFFKMMELGRFPVNQQLRHESNLEYVYLRDKWHDTIGHLPFLYSDNYSSILRAIAFTYNLTNNHTTRTLLERFYWAAIEFGLIKEGGKLKLFGAGLISSEHEGVLALNNTNNTHREYDLYDLSSWNYDPYGIQDRHYIFESLDHIKEELKRIVRLV
jgi:phenylalanine-4-hydroxylase